MALAAPLLPAFAVSPAADTAKIAISAMSVLAERTVSAGSKRNLVSLICAQPKIFAVSEGRRTQSG